MNDVVWLEGLHFLAVDLIIAVAAILLIVVDLFLPKDKRWISGWVALFEVTLAFVATWFLDLTGEALSGAYVGDDLSILFKRIFLGIAALAILGSMSRLKRDAAPRQAEYFVLMLVSLLGMTLLAGVRDLILLIVAFEMMSIPLYLMAVWMKTGPTIGKKRSRWKKPSEAAFKLFVVGAVSSAITMYGLSLVWGSAGTTTISELLSSTPASMHALSMLGLSMIIAGFGFKLGAVPFHMWVPDTYEGAPTPFVAFLSVAPKAAGLVALIHLLVGGFLLEHGTWGPVLIGLVVGSLLLGNLLAIPQQNTKRLLAFSGVAQMGFPLMALASIDPSTVADGDALATIIFFLMGYAVANIGLFLVVEAMATTQQGDSEGPSRIEDKNALEEFAGLHSRSPLLAGAALAFLLSLAGIPFMVGFWTKVYVLIEVWRAGFGWLVVGAAALSVVGLFYYLQIARAMYMRDAPSDAPTIKVSATVAATIGLCLGANLIGGVFPAVFIDAARQAAIAFFGG